MAWSTPTFGGTRRKAAVDAARGTNKQRGYDEHWARISRMKRQECPICQVCNDAAAAEVDHIIPFNGPNDPLRTHFRPLPIFENSHRWEFSFLISHFGR